MSSRSVRDISLARYCAGSGPDGVNTYDVLDVSLARHVEPPRPTSGDGADHQCLRALRGDQH